MFSMKTYISVKEKFPPPFSLHCFNIFLLKCSVFGAAVFVKCYTFYVTWVLFFLYFLVPKKMGDFILILMHN